jgi:hypothetical protein
VAGWLQEEENQNREEEEEGKTVWQQQREKGRKTTLGRPLLYVVFSRARALLLQPIAFAADVLPLSLK